MKKTAEEKTTERLEKVLKNIKTSEDAARYIKENTSGTFRSFKEYFDHYISVKQIPMKVIKEKSRISPNYFYNVVNADRNPSREKVLALCIAAEMSYDETNKALRLANAGALNPKNERDARIAIAINTRVGDVMKVNLLLDEAGLQIIE